MLDLSLTLEKKTGPFSLKNQRRSSDRFWLFYAKNDQNLDPLRSQISEDRDQWISTTSQGDLQKLFLVSVFVIFGHDYVLFLALWFRDQK